MLNKLVIQGVVIVKPLCTLIVVVSVSESITIFFQFLLVCEMFLPIHYYLVDEIMLQ